MIAACNTALLATLTAVASVLSIVLPLFNLSVWGGLDPPAASALATVEMPF
jgi:hypothetical protein